MATWDDVRKLALALPEAEERTSYRKPAYKVAGKNFAWESPHVHGALALNCDPGELPLILEARPEMFFVTPHYNGYPIVLVHLDHADPKELAERIEESWLIAAPTKLADTYAPD
ncbi:MAG: MmcQ/YjbR family DNA-binding protein [Actinomycetota bacterium]